MGDRRQSPKPYESCGAICRSGVRGASHRCEQECAFAGERGLLAVTIAIRQSLALLVNSLRSRERSRGKQSSGTAFTGAFESGAPNVATSLRSLACQWPDNTRNCVRDRRVHSSLPDARRVEPLNLSELFVRRHCCAQSHFSASPCFACESGATFKLRREISLPTMNNAKVRCKQRVLFVISWTSLMSKQSPYFWRFAPIAVSVAQQRTVL